MRNMCPRRKQSLAWREVDGRMIIIHPRRGEVHEFNPTGSMLWRLADGTRSMQDLARALTVEFDIQEVNALEDTSDFFQGLNYLELIDWQPSDAHSD